MILGEYWKLQDDDTLRKLDEAAVRLLGISGCRIEHAGLLNLLEGLSCRVDRGARRCFLPEPLIRKVIAHLGGKAAEAVRIHPGWNPRLQTSHGGSYPHLLEWPSGVRRLATRQDVLDMARMAHVLDEFVYVGKVLTCVEVDQRIEPLWAALQLAQTTDKPIGGGEIFHAAYIEPLVRMGEVLSGKPNDTSLVAGCDFFIAPLIFDRAQAECFVEKRKFGIVNTPGTMPISGISAPVTIAGAVATAVAELIAGWVMGYACNPALRAEGIVASGSMDLRTMAACFGSPEALLQNATVVGLCRRLYGIPVRAVTSYVDCKRPGLEAAFQKMFQLAAVPFGLGLNPGGGGLLSAGQDYSPVQHLLDLEIESAIGRFWANFEVNEETLALELIERVIQNPTTNFLDTGHTLEHYKNEQWYPRWFDRSCWQGTAGETGAERAMLERIDCHVKDAIARYRPPERDPAQIAELRRIFLAAERNLLGGNLTPMAQI